jgi:hypothetical protein
MLIETTSPQHSGRVRWRWLEILVLARRGGKGFWRLGMGILTLTANERGRSR